MIVGPILLHNYVRIFVLFIYAILIAGAAYFVVDIEVHFSEMYFVSDNSSTKAWFETNQEYFQEGGDHTYTYVQNEAQVEFSEIYQ